MAIIYDGRNPQIRRDWNPRGGVVVAPLIGEPIKMDMSSPEYADWHRQKVVLPMLLQVRKNRQQQADNRPVNHQLESDNQGDLSYE